MTEAVSFLAVRRTSQTTGKGGRKISASFLCVPKSEHSTTQIIVGLETNHKNISKPENSFSFPYLYSVSCCPAPASKRSLRWAVLPVSPHVGDQRDAPKPRSPPRRLRLTPGLRHMCETETCWGRAGTARAGAPPVMHPAPSGAL